ncbi:amidase [Albimonas sp. CAU 1670]|uniref:amidase n=1 Tax=Albimonas sp. CAU 1670 TaxID=3032599 RepID=UPI0023D99D82|nr:amidase [Albimonas sp. CAU 1670]MDF2231888.1 amidase [Albimonas sp. CAU 1670]
MSISDAYEDLDATALAGLVAKGEVTPGELLDEALTRAERVDPQINALTNLVPEKARELIEAGLPEGPFRGVPFLLKDLGAGAVGFPVSSGSKLFEATMPTVDSYFYAKLRDAGLVTFGRTTSPEFGCGPATESAVYGGPTRNPWNLERTSGGSSGGSGAAVAARILPAAHASDGAGSTRIPATSCGLFGFKPTRARISQGPTVGEGWGGLSSSGFVTRSVRDNAGLMDVVSGPMPGDPYWAPPMAESYLQAADRAPGKLRIGMLTTTFKGAEIHPDAKAAAEDAAALLTEMGHEVFEAALPQADVDGMLQATARMIAAGTARTLRAVERARGRPIQPGEVEPLAMDAKRVAEEISGADYLECIETLHAFGRAFATYLAGMDVLLTPTLAEPPAECGRFTHAHGDFDTFRFGPGGVADYSPYTAAFNVSGQPAASAPLFWNEAGLPIGVQLASAFGEDAMLMSLCADLERARPWADRKPPVR